MVRDNEIEQLQKLASTWEAGDRNAGSEFVERIIPSIRHFVEEHAVSAFSIAR